MNKKEHLESYVKEHFGTDLCGFLKDKVEKELLYDSEIANILNVRTCYIGRLRYAFGIRRTNGFLRRFERRYGLGAEEIFRTMIADDDVSLSALGNHFGFSREYARQVYEKIHGASYTQDHRRKQLARAKRRLDTPKRGKRLDMVMQVKERIQSFGLSPHVRSKGGHHILLTNGYQIALKYSENPLTYGAKKRFYISNAKGQYADYDFLIALCKSREDSIHYIIPRDAMPRSGVSLFPESGPDKSKYAQFKEAWHLIVHKETRDNRLSIN